MNRAIRETERRRHLGIKQSSEYQNFDRAMRELMKVPLSLAAPPQGIPSRALAVASGPAKRGGRGGMGLLAEQPRLFQRSVAGLALSKLLLHPGDLGGGRLGRWFLGFVGLRFFSFKVVRVRYAIFDHHPGDLSKGCNSGSKMIRCVFISR